MRSIFVTLILAAILISPVNAFAKNVVELKDGTVLEGDIAAISSTKTEIYFVPSDKKVEPRWISISEIRKLALPATVVQTEKK